VTAPAGDGPGLPETGRTGGPGSPCNLPAVDLHVTDVGPHDLTRAPGRLRTEAPDGFRAYALERRAALRRTAYLMCGDWHLAEDVVQDSLARLYADWPRLAARGSVDAYARRTVVNGVLAARRRPWRREVVASSVPDVPDPRSSTEGADDGTRAVLLRALAGLGPSQRAVVVLRYWDDLSVEEVARLLGCSTGNVKSQAARGLAHLRDALAGARLTEEDRA